jgi:ABC-type branched-subunit amino acid transport system substrate-binding protein
MKRCNLVKFGLLAAAVLPLPLAACSSSGSSGSGTSSAAASATSAAAAPGTSSAAASAPSSAGASGTPYKVLANNRGITDESDYYAAVADAINARGGIHGRPLDIVGCDDNNDPNQTTTCFRNIVNDPNFLGAINFAGACGSQYLQLLNSVNAASIGDQLYCPESFQSKAVFAFDAGSFSAAAGTVIAVKDLSQPDVILTTTDTDAGHAFPSFVGPYVKAAGGAISTTVYIPTTAADFSPFAAAIATAKGFLFDGNTLPDGIRLGKALEAQGFDRPVVYNGISWDASNITTNLGSPSNAYISTAFNLSSPGYQQFNADLTKYKPGSTERSGVLINLWLSANVLAAEANKLPANGVTASAIRAELAKSTALNTYGLTIPLNFAKGSSIAGGLVTRAPNACSALYKYNSGKLTLVGSFADVISDKGHTDTCSS